MKSTKGKSAKAEGIEAIEVKQMGATRVGSEKSLAQPSPEDILELFGTSGFDFEHHRCFGEVGGHEKPCWINIAFAVAHD